MSTRTDGTTSVSTSGDSIGPSEVPVAPADLFARLDEHARRGRMPGLIAGPDRAAFAVQDFGVPFESVLLAHAEASPAGSTLRWSVRTKPTLPVVWGVALVLMVWPGCWLTDSMLRTYFSGYDVATWKWYIPLTAPFVPFMWWSAWRKSRASAMSEARTIVDRVVALLKQAGSS